MPIKRDSHGLFLSQAKSYETLLGFESMKYWDMVLRTPRTKDFYFRTMETFLRWANKADLKSPDDFLKIPDAEAVDLIRKFSHEYETLGKGKMAQMVKTVFKSFFSANNRDLKSVHLRVHRIPRTNRTYSKFVPTKKDVYDMADAAGTLRDKAVVLMLWQSGLRNATLRRLTVGHLKEGLIEGESPLKIDVTPSIDKKNLREPYYTFIDIDTIEPLKRYLAQRGDLSKLDESQPLFLSNLRFEKRPMTDASVRRSVKNSARKTGIDPKRIWPHCLRASFYNMLVGKVDDVEREFLFGHEMGIRTHYFAPQWVEKLKNAYQSVGFSRSSTALTKEEVRTEVIGALMGKLEDAELAPIAGKLGISTQQIRSMIRRIGLSGEEEETNALIETENTRRKNGNNNHCESRLINESELCDHINEGWDILKELSNGKILIKRPKLD